MPLHVDTSKLVIKDVLRFIARLPTRALEDMAAIGTTLAKIVHYKKEDLNYKRGRGR